MAGVARRSLAAGRGEIIDIVHETDTSRSVPWARRHKAAQILADLYSPDRPWDGIIIGEPQRAFGSAAQVQDILPRLAEGSAALWVPEVGGPVDPHSEAHDLLLNLFGGLSKAERRRLQTRVKAAKQAQVQTGRFQGGRPPYGYRLEPTGIPHPNPEKARWGAQLHHLAEDPSTSPWVRQIFAWRRQGCGFGTIAAKLDELNVACPSAADRERTSHRSARAWGVTTVKAIVENPRYKGVDAYGRFRKVERLYDRDDPSAGYVNKLVPADEATWVLVDGTIPPLVTPEAWEASQVPKMAPRRGGRRTDTPSRYALRGLLFCHVCGRIMQGNTLSRASERAVHHYRCVYRSQYPGDIDHPRSLAVAEARILPALDAWLGQLFDPRHIEDTIEAVLAADRGTEIVGPAIAQAERDAADARARLERQAKAISAGIDPTVLVEEVRRAQADLAKAESVISARTTRASTAPLTPSAIRAILLRHEGLIGLLRDIAEPHERRRLYADLGLRLTYERRGKAEKAEELVRPSLSVTVAPRAIPWSNSACRRGDTLPRSTPPRYVKPVVTARSLGLTCFVPAL